MISGLPRLISLFSPFMAPKCHELSNNVVEEVFLNFLQYEVTEG